ncbi:Desaturase [Seminavis robusta]|uniref:Desaturase n=1 Tax=Seminavis robusta TaxID=568900 RepID=A0A9N8EQ97_9STRA|nr:Desaturase [Seminavis robusta]|eukprot:Sro1499_g277730.1 Desaturase (146) ;mRNA; r:2409-2846
MFLLILPWLNVLLSASVSSCDAFLLPQSTIGGVTRTTTTDHQRWSSLAASSQEEDEKKKKHVVIVGGGWAGFSAADALAQASDNTNLKITLLDAAPRGKGGLAGGANGGRCAVRCRHGMTQKNKLKIKRGFYVYLVLASPGRFTS